MGIQTCIDTGLHLVNSDDSGYCNICGYQESEESLLAMQSIYTSDFYKMSGLEKSEAIEILKQCFETGDWTAYDNYLVEHSKKVLLLQEQEQKATKNMTKVYVVMEAGLEYNDEIYYQQGWENLGDTAFLTVQEARENAKGRLKHLLSEFGINAFTYDFEGEIHQEVKNWVYDAGISEDTPWTTYIESCEESGIEWITHVPEFVIIREIEVNGTLIPQWPSLDNTGLTFGGDQIVGTSASAMFTTQAIFTESEIEEQINTSWLDEVGDDEDLAEEEEIYND